MKWISLYAPWLDLCSLHYTIRTWFHDVLDKCCCTCLKISKFEIMKESSNFIVAAVIIRDSNAWLYYISITIFMIFSLVLLQTAFISRDDRCWFECIDFHLYKYLGLERSKVWRKMGIKKMGNNKHHCVAIRHSIWNHLFLLVRTTMSSIFHFYCKLCLSVSLFCLLPILCNSRFSFALWPIWSFLTIPLLVYTNSFLLYFIMFYSYCFIYCLC